ncbi:MAG: hypothetical protein IPI67_02410 [Myxococcales bacterium]|nr:hypothetical protein [Myxococcales bacterium]
MTHSGLVAARADVVFPRRGQRTRCHGSTTAVSNGTGPPPPTPNFAFLAQVLLGAFVLRIEPRFPGRARFLKLLGLRRQEKRHETVQLLDGSAELVERHAKVFALHKSTPRKTLDDLRERRDAR